MLGFIRELMKSKWGVVITLAFVALIALAFAGGDVASSGSFGGIGGGDRVAVVGNERIDTSELASATRSAFERMRQQRPTMTLQAFASAESVDQVLDQMIGRLAIAEYANKYGLRAGRDLVNSEILQIPQFRDASGNFDQKAFQAILQQQGVSEAELRKDLAQGLLARQILSPVELGATMPASVVQRYVSLLLESRKGTIAILPSVAYAPQGKPTDAQLKAYYDAHQADYIRPERRVLRYATFGDDALGELPPPTDAEVKAYYDGHAQQYAASEKRSFTQLVVPTQQAAQAIESEVKGGKSLDQSAREKGLSTAKVGPVSQSQLSDQASADVAKAAFGAARGALTAPARGGLGWYVMRIDTIDRTPARTLADARGEIVAELTQQRRREALNELTASIEDEFDNGASLADVAKEHGLKLSDTSPITADGRIYGGSEQVGANLKPVLTTAFAMDEQEPQLAEVDPGKTFVVFEASNIVPSAAAPLAEIRDGVIAAWRKAQGNAAAKEAAARVLKRIDAGQTLAAALAAEKHTLPPPDRIDMKRQQLTQLSQQGRVPSALALMFSMAKGTEKRLEAPNDNGWFVVQLDDIVPGKVASDDPLLTRSRSELGPTVGGEYTDQFVKAITAELGVERNKAAIDAVLAQLSGRDTQ